MRIMPLFPSRYHRILRYAIVIGGDGSFIEIGACSAWQRCPDCCEVNMGTLGYLTEVELTNIEGALERVERRIYGRKTKMMLEGSFDGERMDLALNDIVVTKRAIRVIHFDFCKWRIVELL